MKKTVTKEVQFCDKCGKEAGYPEPCLNCGLEVCYECQDKQGKLYTHAVYVRGDGDGFYCNPCDAKLTASGGDKRHTAYLAIKALRDELEEWSVDFRKRQEKAEKAVRELHK